MQLEDFHFLDDLALLFHTHQQVWVKTDSLAVDSAAVGLNTHKGKGKIFKYNMENTNPITLDGETLKEMEAFTCLVGIIDEQEGSDADVKVRIGKARTAFLQLKNI